MRRDLTICLGLVVLTVAAYWQVHTAGFVYYDDPDYVYENLSVKSGLSWENVKWAFTAFEHSNWHPLTWLSHMLDVSLFGKDADGQLHSGGHHVVNLGLHSANAVLLFLLLRWMTAAPWRSAMVAALFAVHPMHVESVAWVAERKDVLSTCLGLLTMIAYVGYARRPSVVRYLPVFLLFALGLMAKPMLVTLPCLLLLLDYWPLGRLTGIQPTAQPVSLPGRAQPAKRKDNGGRQPNAQQTWRWPPVGVVLRLVLEKLPLVALVVASSRLTWFAQNRGLSMARPDQLALGLRVENVLWSYVAYIGKMFWPGEMAAFYPLVPEYRTGRAVAAEALLVAISVAVAWGAWKGRRYLAVGWLWFLGTLVPVIGFVQVGDQSMADRYTYIPYIGLFVMIVWGASDLLAPFRAGRIALAVAAGSAIAACVVLTSRQVEFWQNSKVFLQHIIDVAPNAHAAYSNMGVLLWEQGDKEEALRHIEEAKEHHEQAIWHWNKAIDLRPTADDAHFNLATVLSSQKDRLAESEKHFRKVIEYKPTRIDARHRLGQVLQAQGRPKEAIDQWRLAAEIQPKDAKEIAQNIILLTDMARFLATCYDSSLRNGQEAVICGEQAVGNSQKNPLLISKEQYAAALAALAAAYAENGNFPEAIQAAESACQTALDAGNQQMAAEFNVQLGFYVTRRPIRVPSPPGQP
jgi:protein O-mannosyl-transferase